MTIGIKIFETILKVAEIENNDLRGNFGKGIFFMPELAFAYSCGKSIMLNQISILGDTEYNWVREKKYKGYGIADLVLESNDNNPEIVIEFKMDNTYHNYLKDVTKLRSLAGNYRRYFCGLKRVLANQADDFLATLEKELGSTLISSKAIKTIVDNSKSEEWCLLSLWEV